ncbi:MAG: ammonium transporter, partial [Holophagales bacterium]|nr:ammonium transporter [Holophagales bacterium]
MKPQFEPLSSRSTVLKVLLAGVLLLLVASAAGAQVSGEVAYVFNTYAFLVWGAFIMWMCAGFTMLEAGSVRTKNASVICMKNIGLYSIAGIAYYVIGYNLMYVDVSGWIGSITPLFEASADEIAFLGGDADKAAAVIGSGYSEMSSWFFQMTFVATTASIVSGALAERVKLWSFLIFTAVLTAVIYPIVGAWTWGGGWLAELGFQDFAGSTIVHSTGGWAALAGIIMVCSLICKFRSVGSVKG